MTDVKHKLINIGDVLSQASKIASGENEQPAKLSDLVTKVVDFDGLATTAMVCVSSSIEKDTSVFVAFSPEFTLVPITILVEGIQLIDGEHQSVLAIASTCSGQQILDAITASGLSSNVEVAAKSNKIKIKVQ